MKVKTKNDKLNQPDSWSASLSGVDTISLGEARINLTGWGYDEAEALRNLDTLLDSLLPRLQAYRQIQ